MNLRPSQEEYGAYYHQYVQLVPDGNIRDILAELLDHTSAYLSDIPEAQGNFATRQGNGASRKSLGISTTTNASWAIACFGSPGRSDSASRIRSGRVHEGVNFDSSSLADLIDDYIAVRRATLTLLRGLSEEAWTRSGSANNNVLTARSLAYIIAGHEIHHLNVVKERYLVIK